MAATINFSFSMFLSFHLFIICYGGFMIHNFFECIFGYIKNKVSRPVSTPKELMRKEIIRRYSKPGQYVRVGQKGESLEDLLRATTKIGIEKTGM
jgi:hypothetical protein